MKNENEDVETPQEELIDEQPEQPGEADKVAEEQAAAADTDDETVPQSEGDTDEQVAEESDEALEDNAVAEMAAEPDTVEAADSTDVTAEAATEENPDTDYSDNVDDAVIYEGDRPIVQELQYQAPRGKTAATEEEEAAETKFSSIAEAKAVIEGFLFSCNEPLSVSKLSKLMSNLHPKTVRGLLLELQWEYENRPGGLQVVEIAGGYQLCTRPFVAPWMFRMHKHKRRSALSPATLETLAIVAYRQPITKGEIEGIRGVESGAPLRTLQELNMVEASGRREVVGRPQLYVTTEQFLKTFGLKSVGDLPSISELKNRFAEEQKLKPVTAAAPAKPEEELQQLPGEDAEPETSEDIEAAQTDETVDLESEPDDFDSEAAAQSEEELIEDSDPLIDDDDLDEIPDAHSADQADTETDYVEDTVAAEEDEDEDEEKD